MPANIAKLNIATNNDLDINNAAAKIPKDITERIINNQENDNKCPCL